VEAKRVRHYHRRLRNLNITIPNPFDVQEFVANVAESRGRPMAMLMLDTSGVKAPCGLWISTQKADYVVVDAAAPPVLRDHILLHEIAHMLCNHQGLLEIDATAIGLDPRIIDPAVVERVLGRSSGHTARYDTVQEQEAEGLASVMREFAARRSPVHNGADAELDRLSAALAFDRRWM
jgi:hypothetical protein